MEGVFMRYVPAISAMFLTGTLSAFAAVDPALLALVPPGTKLVSGVQLDQARSSDFGQYLLNRIHTDDENFQKFTEETGFDPRHDLNEFVFATTGPSADNTHPAFAIIARGTFDQNRIEAKAKASGATVQTYQGVNLILDNHADHHGTGFAFLEGGIAVMADRATLRQIIANRANPTTLDPALQDQVLKVSAANDAWFASSIMPGSFLAKHLQHETSQPMQHAQVLQSILQSSGGVHFGDVVEFSLDATTRSPQDAVSLADVFRMGGSMVQMQRENDPRAAIVASAIDKMAITTDGAALHATFSMTEKNLEQLVDEGHKGRMAASVDPKIDTKPTKP
jgi:hypothetical protein